MFGTPGTLAKISVEDAKNHPKRLTGPAHRPGEKGGKKNKKTGGKLQN
jgi:hypothetical protein